MGAGSGVGVGCGVGADCGVGTGCGGFCGRGEVCGRADLRAGTEGVDNLEDDTGTLIKGEGACGRWADPKRRCCLCDG